MRILRTYKVKGAMLDMLAFIVHFNEVPSYTLQ